MLDDQAKNDMLFSTSLPVNKPNEDIVPALCTSNTEITDPDSSPMFVDEYIVIKEKINSYVLYSVVGRYIKESLTRRFSDFYALREKLVERWPGVYIPKIPHKQAMGNLDTVFIQNRVMLINKFCEKIFQQKEIFNSDEIGMFLLKGPDVERNLQELPPQTYGDILTKYRRAFPGNYEAFDLALAKQKLTVFQKFLISSLQKINKFKEVVEQSVKRFQEEVDNIIALINSFSTFEKSVLMGLSGGDERKFIFFNFKNTELQENVTKLKDGLENPYTKLHSSIQETELDVEAMIEGLTSLSNLEGEYEKITQQVKSLESTIENLRLGKSSLKSMFSFKKKEDTIQDYIQEKESLEKNQADLGNIIKITSYKMDHSIDMFKKKKVNGYYSQLKVLCEIQKVNNQIVNSIWDSVVNNRNIRTLIECGAGDIFDKSSSAV